MPIKGHTQWTDIIQGKMKLANSDFEDMILIKYDGTPSKVLADTVDDYKMRISHVIRGNEWVKDTVK